MRKSTRAASKGAAGATVAALLVGTAPPAEAGPWANCTTVHHRYPHGVGRNHAHDHTSGTPVTNFKHSTRSYRIAMRHNRDLDRDRDGIACEQA
jgi:hypothetical protein